MEKKLTNDTEINVGMIDKKVTDNEIIKALEHGARGYGTGFVGDLYSATLDLIHRLQNEKSQWKSKAEHIEQVYDADREHFIKTTAEQKAEIERLTEKCKTIENLREVKHSFWVDEMKKNVELQKQVDELKAKCQKAYTEGYEQGKFDSAQEKQQAVKDTAKEILQYMETLKVEEDGRHQWRDEHNSCIERISCKIQQKFINGVEVE